MASIAAAPLHAHNAACTHKLTAERRKKEAVIIQQYGTVVAQIVTSTAQIPVQGAAITITQSLPDGTQQLLAVRISNYDGFTEPFDVPTPPLSDSQTRQTEEVPYATVDLRSERVGYDRVLVRGAQVLPGTQTLQRMTLIPTPTLPDSYTQTQEFDIPPQTL